MEKQRTLKPAAGLLLCAAAALSATLAAAAQAPAPTPALKDVAPKGLRIGAAINRTAGRRERPAGDRDRRCASSTR